MSIMDQSIVLKLNKSWLPVGYAKVGDSIIDLCAGINCYALDIEYALNEDGTPNFEQPTGMSPVDWERWITLPVRPWDNAIRSPSMQIRCPTVIVAKNYNEMPIVGHGKNPNKAQIWERDKGIDQYTGKKLTYDEASVDHVIPVSRGGRNGWENKVLTALSVNHGKGNKLNEEVGLRLLKEPKRPAPRPMYAVITEARHTDWKHFLITKNS